MPVTAQTEWLRASTQANRIGVDRDNRRILGYVVAQEGRFKNEDRGEFDDESLLAIHDMMTAMPKGLKSRFTHPTLSADGLGTYLGRSTNPRIDRVVVERDEGPVELSAVRADLQMADVAFREDGPRGNIGDYLLDLAEQDPDAVSSSLVLKSKEEWRVDKKGRKLRDEESGDVLPPLWRPTALHASDIVDVGEAVDGLLSAKLHADGLPDNLVRNGTALLNGFLPGADRAVLHARLSAWLDRYLDLRYGAGDKVPQSDGLSTEDARRMAQFALM